MPRQGKLKSTAVIEEEPEKEEIPPQNIEKEEELINQNKANNSMPVILDSTIELPRVKLGQGNTCKILLILRD